MESWRRGDADSAYVLGPALVVHHEKEDRVEEAVALPPAPNYVCAYPSHPPSLPPSLPLHHARHSMSEPTPPLQLGLVEGGRERSREGGKKETQAW